TGVRNVVIQDLAKSKTKFRRQWLIVDIWRGRRRRTRRSTDDRCRQRRRRHYDNFLRVIDMDSRDRGPQLALRSLEPEHHRHVIIVGRYVYAKLLDPAG